MRIGGGDARDEVARPDLAAVANLALGVVRPALADVLAGEVHDRVASGERVLRSELSVQVPFVRLDAELLFGRARVAREDGDLVTARLQRGHERGADAAGGSGDGDLHGAVTLVDRFVRLTNSIEGVVWVTPASREKP